MGDDFRTTFLFANPSWRNGAARVMDLAGVFDAYNKVGTSEQIDALMLCLDWLAVGDDLRDAVRLQLSEMSEDDIRALVDAAK